MWVEELKRNLTGRLLDIWRGHDGDGRPVGLDPGRREAYRRAWLAAAGGAGAADRAALPTLPTWRPCVHEGPVVENANCNCPGKHVRLCFHPDGEFDRCTRGAVRGSPYPACARCPLHTTEDGGV